MSGYSMKVVSTSSRILSLLVLKPCNLVELTCHAGSKATQAVVNYLEGSHERAGSPVQKAVTAELLANSIRASRLVQGLSDELSSIMWWPRRGVELYNALQEQEVEAIRSKLPRALLKPAQGICPSTKIYFVMGPPGPVQWIYLIDVQPIFRLELFSVQRPLHICCTAPQPVYSSRQPAKAKSAVLSGAVLHVEICSLTMRFLAVNVIQESTGMTASLIVDAAVLTEAQMTLPPHTYISFETGEYALWAAVVAGTQTGLLQLDSTLHGITGTFMPRLYPYRATSAAQPVLACFQANDRLKRRVQQLLTSREEDRLAAVNRMHASRKKANMLRAADLQGQEVLKREAATLLQRSLAAEKLAADRLAALTAKEREAAHLHRSLRDANTALADALEGKKKAREDAAPSPVSMPGENLSFAFVASGDSGFGPTDGDRHAGPPASDEAPEAQDADLSGVTEPATMSGARAGHSPDVHQQQQLPHQDEPLTSELTPSSSTVSPIEDDAGTPPQSASQPTGDFAGAEADNLSEDGDASLIDSPVLDAVHHPSSHGAGAAGPSSSSQEGRTSAPIDPGRTAPCNDTASADTKDADRTLAHTSSSPPPSRPLSPLSSLHPSLTPSDARVSADLTQPAVVSASSSSASSSPVARGPAPADSAGIPDQATQVRPAEDTARASSNSPVAPLSHQSSTDSAAGPAGSGEDDLPDPDLTVADQTHVEAHDLSAGRVSNAADALSASQSSSSDDGGDAANSKEDVLPPAAQSVAAAGVDPLSPENAVDATETFSSTLDAFTVWKSRRVAPAVPGFTGFQPVDPQPALHHPQPAAVHPEPADVDPQPAGTGPQPAAVGPQPTFEVEHAVAETKEGPQWDVQAAPWVPGQADAEVQQQPQQQQAGSLGTDSGLLPETSMSEAAATKQQLQQQLGGLNGNAVPFVPNLKYAKRLQQEKGGMKEGAGPFGKQGAGLLQQQQADSPKIAAVKGGLDLLPDAGKRVSSPSLSPHPVERKPLGVVPPPRPSSAWTPPRGAPPAGPPAVSGPHGGPLPFGPPPPAWGPPPSGPPPDVWGKPSSGPPPGAWGQPASDHPPGVWGQPPSGPFHGPAPHAAMHSNMASGMSHQTAFHPQAATMQPAFAAPVLMQPEYMAPAHLPPPSMGPYMHQAALMQQQQAAAMHMYQQQQLFMMRQQHAAMHGMGEQPYRVDPIGQLPLGARRLQEAVKQQEKLRRQEEKQRRQEEKQRRQEEKQTPRRRQH